ncbi:gliding motility-associated peptidyl-prolyl isomerase GldI [Dokdonia sinensis]|uniref:Peptidyl-prolyl cis-trans isomerase n=1 Tax=Dokdonia sinensis TaxID=2479847 RepID=A0A3M0GCQ6_9FLAO|nr:gliding motility-associated peptidyl-prolyl isomerase GldI [Dokdonia sinensis]RMB60462.1 gliding motility-associated peptidyl-prolyl isomerase GldI [Dokdonia sinensis]
MRNALSLTILCFTIFLSCKGPEARRPINKQSGVYVDNSIKRNKKLIALEEQDIQKHIEKNASQEYIASPNGFWYTFVKKDSTQLVTPQVGDLVSFNYDVKTLAGTSILTTEEVGNQVYQIDQSNQDLISGLREGLKLMKPGEVVTFLLPSYQAYGYYGIDGKIGSNVIIKTTVTLNEIKNKNEDN